MKQKHHHDLQFLFFWLCCTTRDVALVGVCVCVCVCGVCVCVMREKEATAGPATHHNPQPLLFIIKMKRPDVSSSSAVSAVKKKAYHRDNSHRALRLFL